MTIKDTDLDDLLRCATALEETNAKPERGPYYLHDVVPDEGKLSLFLKAMVPLAKYIIDEKTNLEDEALAVAYLKLRG